MDMKPAKKRKYKERPRVYTKTGIVEGFRIQTKSGTVNAFIGIPYAMPPTGENRFKVGLTAKKAQHLQICMSCLISFRPESDYSCWYCPDRRTMLSVQTTFWTSDIDIVWAYQKFLIIDRRDSCIAWLSKNASVLRKQCPKHRGKEYWNARSIEVVRHRMTSSGIVWT